MLLDPMSSPNSCRCGENIEKKSRSASCCSEASMLIPSLRDLFSTLHHLPDLFDILGGIETPVPPISRRPSNQPFPLPAKQRGARDIEHLADLVGLEQFLSRTIVCFLHTPPQTPPFIAPFEHTKLSIVGIVHLSRKRTGGGERGRNGEKVRAD